MVIEMCTEMGCPGDSEGKEDACQSRRPGLYPWVMKIPLEKGMATHSSILACTIPRTEKLGGIQSTYLHRRWT